MSDPSKAETLIALDRTLGNIVARQNLRRPCISRSCTASLWFEHTNQVTRQV